MYIVLEIQYSNDGTIGTFITTHESREEAEQKWHTVLAYASVSSVNVHSAVLMDSTGVVLKRETYYHGDEESEEE